MSQQPSEAAAARAVRIPRHQLDPFAFPSETRGRFVLLMLASVLLATSLGYPLSTNRLLIFVDDMLNRLASVPEVRFDPDAPFDPIELTRRQSRAVAIAESMLPSAWWVAAVPASILLFHLLLAGGHYVTHPRRLRRAHASRELEAGEAPELEARLRATLRDQGFDRLPKIHCKPGVFSADGKAYGFRGRETIFLPQDPALLGIDSPATLCIALHELAHLVNRDAQAIERSRALRFGLFGVGLAVLFHAALRTSPGHLLLTALRLLALLAVTWLLWTGLVRIRELYADWRVSLWGHGEALVRRLRLSAAGQENVSRGGWTRHTAHLLRRWLQVHPSDGERLETLQDPARLFRVSGSLAFVSGVLLAWVIFAGEVAFVGLTPPLFIGLEYIHKSMVALADRLSEAHRATAYVWAALTTRMLLPALFASACLLTVSTLLTRALGVQTLRAAVEQLDQDDPQGWGYLALWRPALLLAVGLEVGMPLMPWYSPRWIEPRFVAMEIPWLLAFAFVFWLWLTYNHAACRLLLAARTDSRRPARTLRLISASSAVLLAMLFWPMVYGRVTLTFLATGSLESPYPEPFSERLGIIFGNPRQHFVVIFVVVSLVLSIVALATFLLWGAGLLVRTFPFWPRHRECGTCGESLRGDRRTVGRSCDGCRRPLAPWAYVSRRESDR